MHKNGTNTVGGFFFCFIYLVITFLYFNLHRVVTVYYYVIHCKQSRNPNTFVHEFGLRSMRLMLVYKNMSFRISTICNRLEPNPKSVFLTVLNQKKKTFFELILNVHIHIYSLYQSYCATCGWCNLLMPVYIIYFIWWAHNALTYKKVIDEGETTSQIISRCAFFPLT